MMLYTESVADQTDHFTDAFRNEVRKFTADAILFRETQCKKMDNLMF